MKPLAQFGLACLLAPGLWAMESGAKVVGGGHAGGGHPGGVTASHGGGHRPGSIYNFGYGYGYGRGYGYPGLYGFGPYGYGGIYGGFFGDYADAPFFYSGYNQPANPGGPVVVVYPPAGGQPFRTLAETAHPVMHDYTQPAETGTTPPQQSNQPVLYLLAFRDGNIHAAMTYWVDDGTLHYLDTDHKEKQAPISTVDRDLSARLNRERHVPFSIQ